MAPPHLPLSGRGRDEVDSPTMATDHTLEEEDIGDGSPDQGDTQVLYGIYDSIPKGTGGQLEATAVVLFDGTGR